jgi:hypothetical protein
MNLDIAHYNMDWTWIRLRKNGHESGQYVLDLDTYPVPGLKMTG